MGRNDQCFCGSGKKQKKCHSNVIENSYIENLYKKYFKIDKISSDYKVDNKESDNHPCQKGCFNCCYDVFSISILEFELILEEIRNRGTEYAENIFSIAIDHLKVLEKDYPELYRRLEEDVTNKDKRQVDALDLNKYQQAERLPFPCPLLDQSNGTCKIYNKRPMICRTHGNTHNMFDRMANHQICEYIPNSHLNVSQTPEIDFADSDANGMLATKFKGKEFLPRQYPIVYWFKIYRDKNQKKGKPVYSSLVPSFFTKKTGTITLAEIMP